VGGWAPQNEKATYPDWYERNSQFGESTNYHAKTWAVGRGGESGNFLYGVVSETMAAVCRWISDFKFQISDWQKTPIRPH